MSYNSADCPQVVNITKQEDIDQSTFPRCFRTLNITNSSESINVTKPLIGNRIIVANNPGLQNFTVNSFSDNAVDILQVLDNPKLEFIELPINFNLSTLKVHDVPEFTQLLPPSIENIFEEIDLKNIGNAASSFNVPGSVGESGPKSIPTVEIEKACPSAIALKKVDTMSIAFNGRCMDYNFDALETVGTAWWRDISVGTLSSKATDTFQIVGSLDVGPSIRSGPFMPVSSNDFSMMQFDKLQSVGTLMNVTGNMFSSMDFSGLETVHELRIENNVNCTFWFNGTLKLTSLYAANNTGTVLAGSFSNLREADNIFLNGLIDTSFDSNIFPSLSIVRNSICIEPWNSDFNCSRLLQRANSNSFNNFYCNGTSNTTSSTARSQGVLSTGAWAGVGVTIGLVVLTILLYLLWRLLLHRKRPEQVSLQTDKSPSLEKETVLHGASHEVAGQEALKTAGNIGTRTEVDGTPSGRVEMAADEPPAELDGKGLSSEMNAVQLHEFPEQYSVIQRKK